MLLTVFLSTQRAYEPLAQSYDIKRLWVVIFTGALVASVERDARHPLGD
jgi:hypothetical protein